MTFPHIPAPDELLTSALTLVGVPILIVSLIGLAYSVKGWIDILVKAYEIAVRAQPPIRRIMTIIKMSPAMLIPYTALAISVVAAQLLALYLCLINGNLILAFFEKQKRLDLEALFRQHGYYSLLPKYSAPLVSLNIFSAVYFLLGITLIGVSYFVNSSDNKSHYVLAAPGILIMGYTGIELAFFICIILIFLVPMLLNPSAKAFSDGLKIILPWAKGFALGLSIYYSFKAAIWGSGLMRRVLGFESS